MTQRPIFYRQFSAASYQNKTKYICSIWRRRLELHTDQLVTCTNRLISTTVARKLSSVSSA